VRLNRGIPSGTYLAELGNWKLYQTADGRYKVCAKDAVNGKANYAFAIDGQKIDSHAALDSAKLRNERPELYAVIEDHFRTAEVIPSASNEPTQQEDEGDPYGDLAITRKRRLSPDQEWKRGLLQMRRIEMEHLAARKATTWESAVRMMWAGIFKSKIPDTVAEKAIDWITQHQGEVSLGVLLQIEQDYYAGKYAPNSCATLEAQLDMLAGTNNEDETEANNNGSDESMRPGASRTAEPNDRSDAFSDFL
jgi:hypothetical protein